MLDLIPYRHAEDFPSEEGTANPRSADLQGWVHVANTQINKSYCFLCYLYIMPKQELRVCFPNLKIDIPDSARIFTRLMSDTSSGRSS